MIVQIYEISSSEEARALARLGVDHIGVLVGKGNFPRELSCKEAGEIFKDLPKETKKVVLSLSGSLEEIFEIVKKVKPDIMHLGALPEKLSPDDVSKIKEKFPGLKVMRSIPVIDEKSVELAKEYDGIADYLLLDTYKEKDNQVGAVGETHDWNISRKIVMAAGTPVILAGGLGPGNVAEAIEKVRPVGVDSKTKTNKQGSHQKDIEKVREFVKIAKSFK